MLCDGSINEKPWEVGISSAYGREHRQIGELASNIPILLEESGNIARHVGIYEDLLCRSDYVANCPRLQRVSVSASKLSWQLMPFRFCVLCDASLDGPAGVAGIGVVIKLVNRDDWTDDHPLLFAWTKLSSPPNRPDLAEEQAILFASILSNHPRLRRRIREICGPNNLISATVLNDCQSAVNRTRINLREDAFLKRLVE